MRQLTVLLLSLFAAMLLSGCADNDFSDLKAYMDEVKSRPKSRIPPLPTIETVAPFAYQASVMRSPFEPPIVVRRVQRAAGGPQVKPDFNRVKQNLEQFPIAQLVMVGTLSQSGILYGLVRDFEGVVHRIRKGDYMGTDHGNVQSMTDVSIELVEIVSDGTGGWVQRARTVALKSVDVE
jgi:type IV pilus assembly protein PilP